MKTTQTEWTASDLTSAEFFGTMEIEKPNGELEYFQIMLVRGERYVFGDSCNAGFLESGYMILENESGELEELHEELETFYRDGIEGCNRIVVNERM